MNNYKKNKHTNKLNSLNSSYVLNPAWALWNCLLVIRRINCSCDNPTWVKGVLGDEVAWVQVGLKDFKWVQYAKNKMHHPQRKYLFFIATVTSFLYFLMCLCMEIWRGVCGVISSAKASLDTSSVWTLECEIASQKRDCTKERIAVYSVIRRVISLLINESLDFDIQTRVLMVRKNRCRCVRAAVSLVTHWELP